MSEAITSADFQKKFGRYRAKAQEAPVFISLYGQTKLVFMSKEHYDGLVDGALPPASDENIPDTVTAVDIASGGVSQPTSRAADIPESDLGEMFALMANARA
jgi:hypothetical protein